MKLKASRLTDLGDVAELLKAGGDAEACRRYLEANAPDMISAFDNVDQAEQDGSC